MQITKTENSITVRFSEEELIFLADSLIDPLAWIEILTVEKVANCKDRLFKEWTAKLQQDKRVESIPTDDVPKSAPVCTSDNFISCAKISGCPNPVA